MASEAGVHFAGFFTNIAVNIVTNPNLGICNIFLTHKKNKFLLFFFLSPFYQKPNRELFNLSEAEAQLVVIYNTEYSNLLLMRILKLYF
jgi:NADH:ubiquinone oxidoreductase subunit H